MKHFFLIAALLITANTFSQKVYKRTLLLMGSRFDITVVAGDSLQGNTYIDLAVAEVSRIERLISEWDPDSETSEINRNAGIQPV